MNLSRCHGIADMSAHFHIIHNGKELAIPDAEVRQHVFLTHEGNN
jgi:hypothetical protein